MTLQAEITALFGADTVREAGQIAPSINSAQAEKVARLATVLSAARTPIQQRQLVSALPGHERTLLCRWLSDRDFADKCVSI